MKRFAWRWLAASSLLLAVMAANAGTRPQYGGTLHVAMRATPTSLDPADREVLDSFARRSLSSLLFDTLAVADESGHAKPALAESWQAMRGNQRWQFRLRQSVVFDDGTPLSAEIAAASLRYANPTWNVVAENDAVVIDLKAANSELATELSLSRNAIVKRDTAIGVSGTGPFRVVEWQPGKRLKLAAAENYWGGRPFLDAIEIEMGKDFREEMTELELGKADVVEVAPEQARRAGQGGRQLASSPPIELVALQFPGDFSSPEEKALRQALALSVERESIRSVLLQGSGEAAGGILPTWMSGYGFVFPAGADLAKARQLRSEIHSVPTWRLGYDASDNISRWLAERIALNARDAGLSLQPTSSFNADIRLVRIPLASADPWISLDAVSTQTGLTAAKDVGGPAEELYAAEQLALSGERLLPLFHLPVTYAATSKLKNWSVRAEGSWSLSNAWLGNGTP